MIRSLVRSIFLLLPCALRRGAVACLFAAVPAMAVVLYWDPNGSASGTGGAGTWDLKSADFLDFATGELVNWPPIDVSTARAVFGGVTGGRVEVKSSTTIQLNQLVFATDGYSLVGGNNGNNIELQFVGSTPALSVAHGAMVTLDLPVSGDSLQLTGGGTIAAARPSMFGQNSRTALTIDGGTTFDIGTFAQQAGSITLRNGTIAGSATIRSDSTHYLESGSVSAALVGNASVVKRTNGTVVLSGASTYGNGTSILAGTLLLAKSGSLDGNMVTVAAGATFGGNGRLLGNTALNLSGTVAPGISGVGLLITGKESWNAGAAYEWEICNARGKAGVDWDLLQISGGGLEIFATLATPFTLQVIGLGDSNLIGRPEGLVAGQSYSWLVAEIAGPVNGLNGFNGFRIDTAGWTDAGVFVLRQQLAGGLTQIYLDYTAAVPEPATYALGLGMMALGFSGWRRRVSRKRAAVAGDR